MIRMIHIQKDGLWKTLSHFEELMHLEGFKKKVDPAKYKFDYAFGFYTETEPVHCGLTNCNHLHNKGVIIKFVNGDVTNIGHICGKKHYSVEFSDSHRSINQSFSDHVNKQTIDEFKRSNPTFINDFKVFEQGVKKHDLYNKCASLIKHGYKNFPVPSPIREKLLSMISTEFTTLEVQKKVKKGYMDDGIVHDPVYSEVRVGEIKGLDFLFEKNRRHILLNDLNESISSISSINEDSDSADLKVAANLCGSIISQVEQHMKVVNKGFDLMKRSNLNQLSEIELDPKEKKQLNRLIVNTNLKLIHSAG